MHWNNLDNQSKSLILFNTLDTSTTGTVAVGLRTLALVCTEWRRIVNSGNDLRSFIFGALRIKYGGHKLFKIRWNNINIIPRICWKKWRIGYDHIHHISQIYNNQGELVHTYKGCFEASQNYLATIKHDDKVEVRNGIGDECILNPGTSINHTASATIKCIVELEDGLPAIVVSVSGGDQVFILRNRSNGYYLEEIDSPYSFCTAGYRGMYRNGDLILWNEASTRRRSRYIDVGHYYDILSARGIDVFDDGKKITWYNMNTGEWVRKMKYEDCRPRCIDTFIALGNKIIDIYTGEILYCCRSNESIVGLTRSDGEDGYIVWLK